jgi:hypothetical protein
MVLPTVPVNSTRRPLPLKAAEPERVKLPPTLRSPPDWLPSETLPAIATSPPTVRTPTPVPGLP